MESLKAYHSLLRFTTAKTEQNAIDFFSPPYVRIYYTYIVCFTLNLKIHVLIFQYCGIMVKEKSRHVIVI